MILICKANRYVFPHLLIEDFVPWQLNWQISKAKFCLVLKTHHKKYSSDRHPIWSYKMYVLSLLNANCICSYRNKMEKISNQASTKKCKKCLPCKINYKENPKRGFVSLQIFDIRVEKSFLGRPHWKWGTFYPRYSLVPTFIVGITICT